MFSDTFRNSESKDTLFSSRSDYRLHGTSTVFLFSPPSEEGEEKERDFFRGKKIGSVDVAAAAAVLNSPSWKGRKKERKKEGKNRKERGREESRGRNSKRKTVRHSIIKRENECGNCGVLSRRHTEPRRRQFSTELVENERLFRVYEFLNPRCDVRTPSECVAASCTVC